MKTLRILSVFLLSLIILGVGYIVIAAGLGRKSAKDEVQSLEQKQEEYISEVILTLTAGSGDYQIGLSTEGPGSGPNRITVDDSSNIYILDAINRRILKYDSKGNFLNSIGRGRAADMCVTSKGMMYVLREDGLSVVNKYNLRGELLDNFGYPIGYVIVPNLRISNREEIFIGDRVGDRGRVYKIVECENCNNKRYNNEILNKYDLEPVTRVPDWYGFYYEFEQADGYALLHEYDETGYKREIYLDDVNHLGSDTFIGKDRKGNFYFAQSIYLGNRTHRREVRKYSPEGELLATIDAPRGYFSYDLINKDIAVDKDGNIYLFYTKEDKTAEVIKWSQYQIEPPQPKERQK